MDFDTSTTLAQMLCSVGKLKKKKKIIHLFIYLFIKDTKLGEVWHAKKHKTTVPLSKSLIPKRKN